MKAKEKIARAAANDWCRCWKCDGVVRHSGTKCDKAKLLTCHTWYDGYRTALLALGDAHVKVEEEPVSEDLEEVAHQYYKPNETFMDGFKKGVNWQKEQMMKDTIIAHVFGRETEKSLFCFKVDGDDYLIGHEVKVVILKDN